MISNAGRLHIDLLKQVVTPSELNYGAVRKSIEAYLAWFPKFVEQSGSSLALITSAIVIIEFNLAKTRQHRELPWVTASPYKCVVTLVDSRGKEWTAQFSDWWFPEPSNIDRRRWYLAKLRAKLRRFFSNLASRIRLTIQSTGPLKTGVVFGYPPRAAAGYFHR